MKSTPNTKKHRPRGEEWLHFLRHRSQLPSAPGRWYANIERESARGESALQFLMWFEARLRTDISDIGAAWERIDWVSLWIRESPLLTIDGLRTDEFWEELTTLRRAVRADWDEHRDGAMLPWTRLYELNLKGTGTAQGDRDPDLLMGWVYAKDGENVKDFWMPRREDRIAKAGQDVANAVKAVVEARPEVSSPDDLILPPVDPEDKRMSRTARIVERDQLDAFLRDADVAVGAVHDGTLAAFQHYLDDLKGQALPTLEGNQHLAKRVMGLADRFGVCLFITSSSGEVKQVRIRASALTRTRSKDTPAAMAGKFSTYTPGATSSPVRETVTFPQLVGARDLEQATRFFAERDKNTPPSDAAE